ncbi:unnamed protein product [Effrenium voratum]|uniref:Phytanoyl-CoA dioxygenase n=1 Tax=Effrenium voratum TaxID=2562239 RepID=A0AA36I513_9DINO|nr:unnamed protein product [Effrenium voratum]
MDPIMVKSEEHFNAVLSGHTSNTAEVAKLQPIGAIQPPRFNLDTDKQQFGQYLQEHGYAVVKNVASPPDIERARSLLWEFLEALPDTQVKRDDVRTWGCPKDWLPSPSNGILHGFGFGQSDFMWHLRMLPGVKEAFAAIWGTDDLLVSFDGGNVFRPWRYNWDWLTSGGWFHCDQNARLPHSRGRVCVQGLVTLRAATAETGGLVVVPGSHLKHEELCSRSALSRGSGDFVPVSVDDPILQDAALVLAEAGDLILWDSRTVHCNTPALAPEEACSTPAEDDWQLIREAGYVCMTPCSFASQEVLQKRREAFEQNVSTSHWPHKFVVAGYALPDTPVKNPSTISKEQRWLIGYDRERRCIVQ